jgi:hypothetical protein
MKNNPFSKSELSQIKSFYQSEMAQVQSKLKHIIDVLNKLESLPMADEGLMKEAKSTVIPAPKKPNVKSTKGRGRPRKVESLIVEKSATAKKQIAKKVKPVVAKKEKAVKVTKQKAVENIAPVVVPKKLVGRPKKAEVKPKAKVKKVVKTVKPKAVEKSKVGKRPIKPNAGSSKVKWNDFIINTLTKEMKPFLLKDFTEKAMVDFKITPNNSERAKMAIAGTLTRLVKDGKSITTIKKSGQKGSYYVLNNWVDSGVLKPDFAG